jgi:predicted histone-like DNA-binding protein
VYGGQIKENSAEKPARRLYYQMVFDAESAGNVGLQKIVKEMESRSAFSLGDAQSVLSNLMEVMSIFLTLGQSIKLEGFGTFRVTVSSDSTATADELNAHHVKGVKLIFQPSVNLKRNLEDISFEITG